ncbi:MAG: integrase, partial [Hyphomicrobiaceae bacterium]
PRQALDDDLRGSDRRPGAYLFPGRRDQDRALTTRQYSRLVYGGSSAMGSTPRTFATHSMRRTKATLIWR